jgi:D-alanyl-D-alanine dipeptidase
MDEAYAFMQRIREYPIKESGEPAASLEAAAGERGIPMQFAARPHSGGLARRFYMRESLVQRLLLVAQEFERRGWVMLIEDAYRSAEMQRSLLRSSEVLDVVARRVLWEEPDLPLSASRVMKRVAALCANWPKTATHMSATAVDISVLDAKTRVPIDLGAAYLTLSHLTPMRTPYICPTARHNRAVVEELMARNGFVAYPYEFWHYSQGDTYDQYLSHSGTAARFGPVVVDYTTGATTPLEDVEAELCPIDEVRSAVDDALKRAVAHAVDAAAEEAYVTFAAGLGCIRVPQRDVPELERLIRVYERGMERLVERTATPASWHETGESQC